MQQHLTLQLANIFPFSPLFFFLKSHPIIRDRDLCIRVRVAVRACAWRYSPGGILQQGPTSPVNTPQIDEADI